MIIVSYDPFALEQGFIVKYNMATDVIEASCTTDSNITALGSKTVEFCNAVNDFDVKFESSLPNDFEEFVNIVKEQEQLLNSLKSIKLEEIK